MGDATAGQWFSDDGARWWFDSGSIALDFAYTAGTAEGAPALDDLESLGDWLADRFAGVDAAVSSSDLVDARELRASIGRLAAAVAHAENPTGDDIDTINLFAATPDIPPTLTGGSRQAGRAHARAAQAFSELAREAVRVFGHDNARRVRECAASDCELIFYDESRSNNRRWCSMQRCGNRAKVRGHRERLAGTR